MKQEQEAREKEYKIKMELKMKEDAAKVAEHTDMLARRKSMFEA